jgi:hypothetical protein
MWKQGSAEVRFELTGDRSGPPWSSRTHPPYRSLCKTTRHWEGCCLSSLCRMGRTWYVRPQPVRHICGISRLKGKLRCANKTQSEEDYSYFVCLGLQPLCQLTDRSRAVR